MRDTSIAAAVFNQSDQNVEHHASVPESEDQHTDWDREPTMHRLAEQNGLKEPVRTGLPSIRTAGKGNG